MAKKPVAKAASSKPKNGLETSEPKLPYSQTPNALRKFLKLVPSKPKPPKVNNALLSAWDLGGSNSNSILRVLKAIGFIDSSNQPTPDYITFMDPKAGPARLARVVRDTYAPLFDASHAPHKESDETLKRLFNIHSGGAERTLQYQVATFKALCEFANFDAQDQPASSSPADNAGQASQSGQTNAAPMTVHIDLHIHLPPDKGRRDYEYMFEDIGRYIYGRTEARRDER